MSDNPTAVIDGATLLQVDATVMVGIFIFLTIRGLIHDIPLDLRRSRAWLRVISILVIPFAGSAMLILVDTGSGELTRLARIATFGGFLYIFGVFVFSIIFTGISNGNPLDKNRHLDK